MRRKKQIKLGLTPQLIVGALFLTVVIMFIFTTVLYRVIQDQLVVLAATGNLSVESYYELQSQIPVFYTDILSSLTVPMLFVVLLIFFGAFGFGFYVSKPLRTFVRMVAAIDPEKIGKSKESFSLQWSSGIFRDELDELVNVFNKLYAKIEENTKTLHNKVEKRTLALKHSNQVLRDFVYYTAHRLRTPLNIIRWSVDLLKSEEKGKLNREQRETISELEESLISVIELADDMQDSLVLEQSEKITEHHELVDIKELIDQAAGEVAVLARQKDIQLVWKPNKGSHCGIYGYKERLMQAIIHLLKNAILYNVDHGSVSILLKPASEIAPLSIRRAQALPNKKGNYIYISVKDSGIGIPDNEVPHIFDRFFRGKIARQKWVDGAGIELAVTRTVIQLHGGAIWFKTKVGSGSTFTISLPTEECKKADHKHNK